jgi:hypothetical protein
VRTATWKIDGIHFGGQVRVVALGIAESGEKHVWECGKERRRTPRWSREEGLEETLRVHRLGVGAALRRKLATTNPIESCLSTVQRVARNVKRWQEGDEPLRWTASGLLEAEKKFRHIKGYQEILFWRNAWIRRAFSRRRSAQ